MSVCEKYLKILLATGGGILSCSEEGENKLKCEFPYALQFIPGFPNHTNYSCHSRDIVNSETEIMGIITLNIKMNIKTKDIKVNLE